MLSKVESVAAVACACALVGGRAVDVGCGVGDVAEAIEDLIALVKQLGGLVAGRAGRVGGGEVVFDALGDGGGLLAAAVGSPQVLCGGQVVVEGAQQGVGWSAAVGGGDEDQFGVGGCSGLGEPAQLFGG